MDKKKESLGSRLAGSEAFLSVAASLICIVIGLLLGVVVLAMVCWLFCRAGSRVRATWAPCWRMPRRSS